ncbi:uncharacterized protein BCR38DRAFT_418749 [Pseudomassariella vexata]|uniref:Uncharacterized protein n=1 Tax=Pseudomassariella vexata TaxID=1141098 RepID=A0A1Y2EL91_9PEZI|nr:uncharacterized protein BCR38DRAFT_418749 [Pseudomassariella vexata]ORY72054.1 hypothetical protein BCR38DRAFT_418749 [Pseudomassariella vexata]
MCLPSPEPTPWCPTCLHLMDATLWEATIPHTWNQFPVVLTCITQTSLSSERAAASGGVTPDESPPLERLRHNTGPDTGCRMPDANAHRGRWNWKVVTAGRESIPPCRIARFLLPRPPQNLLALRQNKSKNGCGSELPESVVGCGCASSDSAYNVSAHLFALGLALVQAESADRRLI